MAKHERSSQAYKDYIITVEHDSHSNRYCAYISISSLDKSKKAEEIKVVFDVARQNKAYKEAQEFIDSIEGFQDWKLICGKNDCELYVRYNFDVLAWESKVIDVGPEHVFLFCAETKELAISEAMSYVKSWKEIVNYFGIKSYYGYFNGHYLCKVNRQILPEKFVEDLMAIDKGFKEAVRIASLK